MQKSLSSTRALTAMAMLAALAVVLVAVIHFPILPAAPFLEYDPANIPIFISAFLFGPVAGLAVTVVVSIIQGLTVSASSGVIGIVMHILATGSFVVLSGLIYRKSHTRKGAAVALLVGSLAMTTVMVLCNIVFTPLFLNRPVQEVIAMLLPVIIPFNLLKAGINSIITYIIYKPVSKFLTKSGLIVDKTS